MERFIERTAGSYLDALSSATIAPGGGSAAALTAACGAALNLMVLNYAADRGRETLAGLISRQTADLDRLRECVDEDCRAFTALMKALSGGEPAEEKYIEAAAVPLDVMRGCAGSMSVTEELLEKGGKSLRPDVGCAAETLYGAFMSARYNVEVNLAHVRDVETVSRVRGEMGDLEKNIRRGLDKVRKILASS